MSEETQEKEVSMPRRILLALPGLVVAIVLGVMLNMKSSNSDYSYEPQIEVHFVDMRDPGYWQATPRMLGIPQHTPAQQQVLQDKLFGTHNWETDREYQRIQRIVEEKNENWRRTSTPNRTDLR